MRTTMACSTIWLWFLDGGCIVTVFQFVWCRFVSLAFVAFCFVRSFIASASSFAAMYKGLSRLHPVPLFPKQFTTVAVFDALKEWPPWCETVWPGLWLVPCICPPLSSLFASLLVAWCVRPFSLLVSFLVTVSVTKNANSMTDAVVFAVLFPTTCLGPTVV